MVRSEINGRTRLLGVIGDKIGYTLSPAIENAALEHCNLNYRYVALSCPPRELPGMVEAVRLLKMPGANVTIPHKERVIPLLDEIGGEARRVGAVNTLVNRDGRLTGRNTDIAGFEMLLGRIGVKRCRTALVAGAGGAARAVVAVLLDGGMEEIVVACRKKSAGRKLIDDFGAEKVARAVPWEERGEVMSELLVNATPLARRPSDPLPLSRAVVLRSRAVADLVVRPGGTRFVSLARSAGIAAEGGSVMLAAQGRESFRLWFGRRPPLELFEKALERAIDGEGPRQG